MDPYRTLMLLPPDKRMTGEDVSAFQVALNGHLSQYAALHDGNDRLSVDGSYGPLTSAAYGWVGWYSTGFFKRTISGGAGVDAQRLIRLPRELTANHRKRAAARRSDLTDPDRPA